MFDALKSRYITGGSAVSCKYSSPLAAPSAIFILVPQSKGFLFGGNSEKEDFFVSENSVSAEKLKVNAPKVH